MNEGETACDGQVQAHMDWPKVLEWVEKQGQDNLKARFATADLLAKEAQNTLTVLLAAIGGSAVYALKIFDHAPASPLVAASAVVCVYLVALSLGLVMACMMFQPYPALHQDPVNLMQRQHGLTTLREAELLNLNARIQDATRINSRRVLRLNRIRIAAVLSPLVFGLAALLSPVAVQRAAPPDLNLLCEPSGVASAPMAVRMRCRSGS